MKSIACCVTGYTFSVIEFRGTPEQDYGWRDNNKMKKGKGTGWLVIEMLVPDHFMA